MELKQVMTALHKLAPPALAAPWDNVGLLIEPSCRKVVSTIMLCNDLTSDVMDECVSGSADLIIAYHPPIFKPLKRLTQRSWKEQVVTRCIRNDIALYSPHTSLDAVSGGINDWLISPFGTGTVRPIQNNHHYPDEDTHCVSFESTSVVEALAALQDVSSLTVRPSVDRASSCVTAFCSESTLPEVMRVSQKCSSLFNKIRVAQLAQAPSADTGYGRSVRLDVAVSLSEAVDRVKRHLGLKHLRLAVGLGRSLESEVHTVAVCAGSGSSVLANVQADLLITGEMSHHEVLDAIHASCSVMLCEHSNTERGYLRSYADQITALLNVPESGQRVNVLISKADHERLRIV